MPDTFSFIMFILSPYDIPKFISNKLNFDLQFLFFGQAGYKLYVPVCS